MRFSASLCLTARVCERERERTIVGGLVFTRRLELRCKRKVDS